MVLQDLTMNLLQMLQEYTTIILVYFVGMMKFLSLTQVIGIGVQYMKEPKNNTFAKGQ
jgi:hypothetical protein